jgi:hypothetical protein
LKLSAIIQARALAFVELYDLDPRGRTFFPDTIKQIQQRYGFLQVPKIGDAEEQKGIELKTGKSGNKVIDVLKIFPNLFVLETHSNTTDSKQILEGMFEWGKQELGLTYEPSMILHWGYVSILSFYSESNIVALANNPAAKLAAKVSKAVTEIWEEPILFESRGLSIGHDPLARKNGIASLLITPRSDIPYEENKFYSEAPLPTDMHIKFLEEFEADVLAAAK